MIKGQPILRLRVSLDERRTNYVTRKKPSVREAHEQEEDPLSGSPTASGQVKRFRGGSGSESDGSGGSSERERTRENDIETLPPTSAATEITNAELPNLKQPPVPRARISGDVDTTTSHLRRRFDLSAALEIARSKDKVGAHKPTPPIEVRDVNKEARRLIERQPGGVATPKARLPMSCVPRRAMARREIMRMPLDHRQGFVLAHIDGEMNIRSIIDVCAMPETEVCAVIERLIALRVIVLS